MYDHELSLIAAANTYQKNIKSLTNSLYFFPIMVLELDGNSDHVAHACRKIILLEEKNIRSVTALDLNKYLNSSNN